MKSRNLVIWITILFYINWDVMVFLKVFVSVVKLRDPRQNRDYRTVDYLRWRPRNPQRLPVTSYLWWMATTIYFIESISNSKRKIHWRKESMWNGYFNFIGSRNRKLSFWTYKIIFQSWYDWFTRRLERWTNFKHFNQGNVIVRWNYGLQWCWRQRDVGDNLMLVITWCWWLYGGDIFKILVTES